VDWCGLSVDRKIMEKKISDNLKEVFCGSNSLTKLSNITRQILNKKKKIFTKENYLLLFSIHK